MAEFNIRSDSVDVERIMQQIRARVREKRGADYTEEQIRQLASVKLEKFLDPRKVRSDLTEHYRRQRRESLPPLNPLPPLPSLPEPPRMPSAEERPHFEFDPEAIYRSSRGVVGRVLYLIRKLLNPVLKLFFNPTPIVHALHRLSEINMQQVEVNMRQAEQVQRMLDVVHQHGEYLAQLIEHLGREVELIGKKFALREELDALNYEVLNNLVVEMTRLSIDVKNHRMRVESIAGRLDFDERRARALESVVQYRSTTQGLPSAAAETGEAAPAEGGAPSGEARRRRRRRRGRRRGAAAGSAPAAEGGAGGPTAPSPDAAAAPDITPSAGEPDDDTGTSEP